MNGDAMTNQTWQIMEQSNRIGVQFLITDLAVALTFLDFAEVSHSEDTRRRNRQNAQSAYDTVLRLLPRLAPSPEERATLEIKLAELKDRLMALGSEPDKSLGT
jgi:hypothetical protein